MRQQEAAAEQRQRRDDDAPFTVGRHDLLFLRWGVSDPPPLAPTGVAARSRGLLEMAEIRFLGPWMPPRGPSSPDGQSRGRRTPWCCHALWLRLREWCNSSYYRMVTVTLLYQLQGYSSLRVTQICDTHYQ